MKKLLLLFFFLSLAWVPHAKAQSSAAQVLPGYLQLVGCPGLAPCYQYQSTPVKSATVESSHVLKVGTGTLFGLSVTSSATGYILIYDATSAPSDGSVTPTACYYLNSGPGTLGIAFTPFPIKFVNGIVVVFSSTGCFTQTSSATMFVLAEVI